MAPGTKAPAEMHFYFSHDKALRDAHLAQPVDAAGATGPGSARLERTWHIRGYYGSGSHNALRGVLGRVDAVAEKDVSPALTHWLAREVFE